MLHEFDTRILLLPQFEMTVNRGGYEKVRPAEVQIQIMITAEIVLTW